MDASAAVYVISVAAELTGLHPQTLRTYERLGLVTPARTGGGGRRYSQHDIEHLRTIAELTSAGIGLEGVRRILELTRQIEALATRNQELETQLQAAKETFLRLMSDRAPEDVRADDSRVPAIRRQADQSVVLWRRAR